MHKNKNKQVHTDHPKSHILVHANKRTQIQEHIHIYFHISTHSHTHNQSNTDKHKQTSITIYTDTKIT